MADIRNVYQRGIAQMQAAIKEAELDYQHSALAEDVDGMGHAAVRMAGLQSTYDKFVDLANRTINPQRAPAPTNQHGLTAAESEAARFSGVTDEEYGRNKARLWGMRNRGEYPMPGQG
jgi:phage I-like protein